MKIKIFSEVKEKKYEAIINTVVEGETSKFIGKPYIKEIVNHVSYNKILEFNGEMAYNDNGNYYSKRINVSENETVYITKEIFRADLNEYHVFVDKIKYIENKNIKRCQEDLLNDLLKTYNKTMIEQDEKLNSYCKLHNLKPQNTDCEELFKLVYDKECKVKDGKLVESDNTKTIYLSSAIKNSFSYIHPEKGVF